MSYLIVWVLAFFSGFLLFGESWKPPKIPLEILIVLVTGAASFATSYMIYDYLSADIEQEIVLERATSPSDGLERLNRSHYMGTRSKKRTARFQEDGLVMVPSAYHWFGSSIGVQSVKQDTLVTAQGDTIVYSYHE